MWILSAAIHIHILVVCRHLSRYLTRHSNSYNRLLCVCIKQGRWPVVASSLAVMYRFPLSQRDDKLPALRTGVGKQPPRLWCSFKTPCSNIVGATCELLSRASREDGKNSVVTGVSDPSTYKPWPQWKERFWRLWITHCVNIVPVTLKDSGICISKYWTIIFNKVEHNFGLGGVHPSFPPQMYYPCSYFYCSWANCSHEISVVQLLKGKLPPFLSTVPYGVKGVWKCTAMFSAE